MTGRPDDGALLRCGDPRTQKSASFSRFALPFAFSLVPVRGSRGPYYRELAPPDEWRRTYFTIETADVLFQRARWFELAGPDGKPTDVEFRVVRGARPWTARVHPPRIVLFEAEPVGDGGPDPMRTAFLIVDVSFSEAESISLDDLLDFNAMFRCWRPPYEDHDRERRHGVEYRAFLAECPAAIGALVGKAITDDGKTSPLYAGRWACLLDVPVFLNGLSYRLFPERWRQEAARWLDAPSGKRGWIVHDDHHTFVWTCAVVDRGWHAVRDRYHAADTKPESCGHWVKLLNIDRAGADATSSSHCTDFESRWVDQRTYSRFQHVGTLYGFNHHGGAMLATPSPGPDSARNFGGMYFDQTLLLLYLRVAIFRFSESLTRCSMDAETGAGGARHRFRDDFRRLRRSFAVLTNLYQFPLLSNQQQGIEMYVKTRAGLDIDEMYREVKEEIESTHKLNEMETAQETATVATLLTTVATIGLIPGLVFAFLGMNVLIEPLRTLLPWAQDRDLIARGSATAGAVRRVFGLDLAVVIVGIILVSLVVLLVSRHAERFLGPLLRPRGRDVEGPRPEHIHRWLRRPSFFRKRAPDREG